MSFSKSSAALTSATIVANDVRALGVVVLSLLIGLVLISTGAEWLYAN